MAFEPTKPVVIGRSSDGRTNRWKVKCPACSTVFEPRTTMFNFQSMECPKPKCSRDLVADYETELVRVVE